MFKYLAAALLLLSLVSANDYFLTPPYLTTGFEGQYYEVRFRVRGMPRAEFTFSNLPAFLKGSSSGVISGTPTLTGSFKFRVAYSDGQNKGEQEQFLSITSSPNSVASEKQNKEVVELIVATALNSWIYRVNDQIDIQLETKGGKNPIAWNFRGLPEGLLGGSDGRIRGSLKNTGLYTFSAECGDAVGQKASSYYTLNVQPGTLIKTNNIIDVPDRNVGVVYDIKQVEEQQIAADRAVTEAIAQVAAAKAITQGKQEAQAKAQLAFNLALKQENAAEATVEKLTAQYDRTVEVAHRAEANLGTAKNIVAIATTAVKNAKDNVAAAEANLAAATAAFNSASAAFKAANDAYIKAKVELSQAELDHQNALAAYKDAENNNGIAWNNVQAAKSALDAAKDKLLEATQAVANARNNVDLATQANDDALTNLNIADAALAAAQHALEDANRAVADLRAEHDAAKTSLGTANFNLQQALNNLFVAEAAKAAADKAVSLAYAQGIASLNITKGESTYVFNGCVEQVYPSITGTVAVSTLITSGAKLNSGQILTWGACTQKTEVVAEGDVISFHGTIKNGVISATQITKVKA